MSKTTSPKDFIVASKPYHLTIGDVLNFPVGKIIRIYFLDRNMFDLSCDDQINPIGQPIRPSEFFRRGYFIDFTRRDDLKGTWRWTFDDYTYTDNDREFDLALGEHLWYPMKDSKVPEKDWQGIFTIPEDFAGKHYQELPLNTKIGWRGPMMLASNMDKCPDVVMKKNYSVE